jgi:hypothetical protein
MLDKWPLYFNHAPAAEMWSVVLGVSSDSECHVRQAEVSESGHHKSDKKERKE